MTSLIVVHQWELYYVMGVVNWSILDLNEQCLLVHMIVWFVSAAARLLFSSARPTEHIDD